MNAEPGQVCPLRYRYGAAALALPFDAKLWGREFLADWPPSSPA